MNREPARKGGRCALTVSCSTLLAALDRCRDLPDAGEGPLLQMPRKAHQRPENGDKRIAAILQIEFEPVGREDRRASHWPALRSFERNYGSLEHVHISLQTLH